MLHNAIHITTQLGRRIYQQRSVPSIAESWKQAHLFCTVSIL